MKQLLLHTNWIKPVIIFILGLYALGIEISSFADLDFNGLHLIALIILSFITSVTPSKDKDTQPFAWAGYGMFFWGGWRFLDWVLNDRIIFAIINFLTRPAQRAFGVTALGLIIPAITISLIIWCIAGNYWIYKHFKTLWPRWSRVYLSILLIIILSTAVYTSLENTKDSCFGIVAITQGMHCHLRASLGVIGTFWVTTTLLIVPLTLTLQQTKIYGTLASIPIVTLTPVWIEAFFNPAQVLGIPMFKLLRASPFDISTYSALENYIKIIGAFPVVVFFILIPIGLLLSKSEKFRLFWIASVSAITFAIILAILFEGLNVARLLISYSVFEHSLFYLQALQLWLPLALITIIGYRLKTDN